MAGLAELDGDADGVAVDDRDAIATGAHARSERLDDVAIELAQQLEHLLFHLLFFVADVGNDVVEDVHGGYAGIARAADGLHGGGKDLLDSKAIVDGLESQHRAHDRAVGVGDDVAARLLAPGLLFDQVKVFRR